MKHQAPITLPDDIELDMFSEETLAIAEAIHKQLPNTWKLLYENGLMPDMVKLIATYRKKWETDARVDELTNAFRELNKEPFAYKLDYYDNRISELQEENK